MNINSVHHTRITIRYLYVFCAFSRNFTVNNTIQTTNHVG